MAATSPLAPAAFPSLPAIGGVRFAAAEAGIRDGDRILNPDALKGLEDHAPAPVTLTLNRDGRDVTATFTPAAVEKPGLKWVRTALPDSACDI